MVFQTIFNFFGLLAIAIMLHEIGHLAYLWLIRKPAVLHYKLGGDIDIDIDKSLTDNQYRNVLLAGIIIGTIPFAYGIIFLMGDQLSVFMTIGAGAIYFFYGVNSDLKELRKLRRKK